MATKIKKTESIKVPMTRQERAALDELAASMQLTPTEFMRDLVRTMGRRAGLLPTVPTVDPTPGGRAV